MTVFRLMPCAVAISRSVIIEGRSRNTTSSRSVSQPPLGAVVGPGGFPVVAMFLATSLGLPFEAVGLLIAVDWFAGIFRTFLNVNGDTFVAMLVAKAGGELDADVYNGTKQVVAEVDVAALEEQFAKADAAD